MKDLSLDDLRLFLAVADAGSLGAAARLTGVSAPTLSRRMTALERQVGRRLFERGGRGYALTAQGRALRDATADLRGIAARVARIFDDDALPRVRISAGTFTAEFLARHLPARAIGWVPELVAADARVDLARREADIGIRNARPDQPWLAGRQTARITYALFGTTQGGRGMIALTDPATPSQRWLHATQGDRIVTTVGDARLARDLACAGLGQVVLPRFAARPPLRMLGTPIDALAHGEWLTTHHDARHDPPVRAALDTLATLLSDRALRT